ncbi:MAG: glycerophosphodiester phosphodiesterase [Deltaproteobacteria bacterium]|nr:glycerophosphodiester phosphodiesterase [Deltaproteobacteria bacterium]
MIYNPLVIAHRGGAGLAPENTLTAFREALSLGVDGLEMDVLLTADQQVVVYHDYRLNPAISRDAEGSWLIPGQEPVVKDISLDLLKTYDVGCLKPGSSYAQRYPHQKARDEERIPTLGEVISLLKDGDHNRTTLWVEIKTSPVEANLCAPPEAVVDEVLEVLHHEDMEHRTLILSFDWRALQYVQRRAPAMPTVYLSVASLEKSNIMGNGQGHSPWTAGFDIADFKGSIPQMVRTAGGTHWGPYYQELTAPLLQEAHELGLRVAAWTPDSLEDMERLQQMGVDAIVTNRPDLLLPYGAGNNQH